MCIRQLHFRPPPGMELVFHTPGPRLARPPQLKCRYRREREREKKKDADGWASSGIDVVSDMR